MFQTVSQVSTIFHVDFVVILKFSVLNSGNRPTPVLLQFLAALFFHLEKSETELTASVLKKDPNFFL